MIAAHAARAASGLAVIAVLSGCDSSAERSARLAAAAKTTKSEKGLRVAARNPGVRVLESAAVSDANGTAVVVTLRDTTATAMAGVPIAIDVRGAAGRSIFRNDQPGADAGLVSVPLLSPRRDFSWVHDQVQAGGAKVARVNVRVGAARRSAPARPPHLTLGRLVLEGDGAGGTEGRGRVTNRSSAAIRQVTVYAVARRAAKVVAAGRAVIGRIAPGRAATFSIFFIGDPARAHVSLSATPAAAS